MRTFKMNTQTKQILLVTLVTSLSLFTSSLAAQEFSTGIRPEGMGDAFTAVADGAAAIYHNPAGAARSVMYTMEGSYEYTPTGNVLNASIVDSKTNPSLAAGLGYSYYFARDSKLRGHDIRLGLALPVVPNKISVGIGGRYLLIQNTFPVANKEGVNIDTEVDVMKGFTLDAGIMMKLSPSFHLGISGQNLIDPCERADCKTVAPTIIQGGLGFTTEDGLVIAADIGGDLTSGAEVGIDVNIGAEYLISVIPIRIGYIRKGVSAQNWVTFGFGWRSKAAGIDAGMKLNLGNTKIFQTGGNVAVYF